MKSLLLALLMSQSTALLAADAPAHRATRIDTSGRLEVEVEIPAGARHAVLEYSATCAPPWRSMIAAPLSGSAATVVFRLPRPDNARGFARVRVDAGEAAPVVELNDPALWSVLPQLGSEQAKIDLLGLASARMRELAGKSSAEYRAALLAWALAQPGVVGARASRLSDDISIHFADGDVATLMARKRASDNTNGAPGSALGTPALQPHTVVAKIPMPGVPTGLPKSNTAVTAFSLESKFPNAAPTIFNWLGRNNYQARNFNTTTVDEIMAWSSPEKPLGVLFWQAHGPINENPDGTYGIGIVTGQYATSELSHGRYAEMRRNRELLLAAEDKQAVPFYQVTSAFVRKYMHFAEGSLVTLDVCYGGNPEIANAFIGAGAGSVGSWDWLSGDRSTTVFCKLYDRLLGMNEEPPISAPRERSFALPIVRWWMEGFQYDIDPSPKYVDQKRENARLTWYQSPTVPANILKPTIMRVIHEFATPGEAFTKLLIEGNFGTDPGEGKRSVLWGGREMKVQRWEPDYGVVIRIPDSPPAGNIQVVLRDTVVAASNEVPMTEWNVPFTYVLRGEGSQTLTMDLKVKLRADIHGHRGMPEMPVEYLPLPFSNVADCTGSLTASGSYSPHPSATVTWSGGSEITSVDPQTGQSAGRTHLVTNGGLLNPAIGLFQQFNLIADADFTQTQRIVDNEGRVFITIDKPGAGLNAALFFLEPPRYNVGSSAFIGDTKSFGNGSGGMTLSWPSVTPTAAPEFATPR